MKLWMYLKTAVSKKNDQSTQTNKTSWLVSMDGVISPYPIVPKLKHNTYNYIVYAQ